MSQTFALPEQRQFELALHLHQEGMFGVHEDPNDFITLKSGRISPHYLDARQGISSVISRAKIGWSLLDLAAITRGAESYLQLTDVEEKFDHIAGTPEAFTAYATTMADLSGLSLLQPRVARKVSGNKAPILGRYNPGDTVDVFDDVVTDGETKIDTIESLGAAGLVVAGYLVIMNRQEGGVDQVAEATGIQIVAALDVANVVKMLRAENIYSETQFDNVKQYLEQYGDPGVAAQMGTA